MLWWHEQIIKVTEVLLTSTMHRHTLHVIINFTLFIFMSLFSLFLCCQHVNGFYSSSEMFNFTKNIIKTDFIPWVQQKKLTVQWESLLVPIGKCSLSYWRSVGWIVVNSGAWSSAQVYVWKACSLLTTPPCSQALLSADGSTWWEWLPYLRAELVGLHLGLLFESIVSIVVSEGVLNERGKHKHVTDPEVHVQRLDGWCSWQGWAGTHHQCGHGENGCDPCGKIHSRKWQIRVY